MIPQSLQPWLWEGHAMTHRLQQHMDQLRIKVMAEYWQQPSKQMARQCHLPLQNTFIREVILCNQDTPWIIARSHIPQSACQRSGGKLTRLAEQPLGTYVFLDPRVKRTHLSWACLKPHHADFQWAISHCQHPVDRLWARRSALQWRHCSIIVCEIFLPAIYEHAI